MGGMSDTMRQTINDGAKRSAHASANARDSRRQGELDGSSFRTVVGFLFSLEVYKLAVPLSAG